MVHRKSKTLKKRIDGFLLFSHCFMFVATAGLLIISILGYLAEQEQLGVFGFTETRGGMVLNSIVTTLVFIAVSCGLYGQLRGHRKSYWTMYILLMGMTALVLIGSGLAAIIKATQISEIVRDDLTRKVLETYRRDPQFQFKKRNNIPTGDLLDPHHEDWDKVQKNLECCGLDNYQDWGRVQFGRTSLIVPHSCCRKEKRSTEIGAAFCAVDTLPSNPVAERENINPRGCLPLLIRRLRIYLYIRGVYSLTMFVIQLGLAVFVTYLIISKKL